MAALLLYPVTGISQFAGVDFGARSVGLGGALVSAAEDASATFWNPALLSEVRQPSFLFDVRKSDELRSFAASAFLAEQGSIGLALWQQPCEPGMRSVALAWSRPLWPHLNCGFSIAFSAADTTHNYTYGVGLSWRPSPFTSYPEWLNKVNRFLLEKLGQVRFGIAYLGLPFGGGRVRREFRAGVSLQPAIGAPVLHLSQHWSHLGSTTHFGLEIPLTHSSRFYLGAPQWNIRRMGLGMRLTWQQLHVDVTYSSDSQRLIATLGFLIGDPPELLADRHLTRGTDLTREKKFRQALRELRKSVAYDPDSPRSWRLFSAVSEIVRREDAELDSIFQYAEALQQRGDFVASALAFSQILERNPEHKQARQKLAVLKPAVDATLRRAFRLGVQLYEQEEYAKARQVFERVLLINPNHQGARDYLDRTKAILHSYAEDHFLQGLGFYRQRNLTRAYEEFSRALELDPEYEEARKYFEQVSREKEDLEKMLDRLLAEGEDLARRGNAIQASIKFRKVLEVDTGNRVARQKLLELQPQVDAYIQRKLREGKKALAEGRLKAARAAFQEILRIVPTHEEANEYDQRAYNRMVRLADENYQNGLAEFEEGNYEKALRYFERALTYLPTHAGAKRMRKQTFGMIGLQELAEKARQSYEQGDYLRAMAMFSQILESDPDNAMALRNVERCQQRLNELAESHFNRGISLYAAEDYVAAIEEMEKALELNPNHRGAQEYKRRAEARLKALRSIR